MWCWRWQCQRSARSSELPTAVVSMCTRQEESLDPDPRWRRQMRKNWIIQVNSMPEL